MDKHQPDATFDVPEVLRRHRATIWRLVAYFTTDADETLDMVEELLVRALLDGERFHSETALTTWLYRVALDTCHDGQLRDARRRAPEAVTAAAVPAELRHDGL